MRRVIFLASILVLFVIGISFADEQLTITTYYPSPYGSYAELRAQRMAIGDNYSSPSYCWSTSCGVNQIPDNTDLVVQGNVGIGTTGPSTLLHVQGAVSSSSPATDLLTLSADGATGSRGKGVGLMFKAEPTAQDSAFTIGRIYSIFDGNAYGTSRITLQGENGSGTMIDALSIKSGNVGIGTTSPGEELHVLGSTYLQAIFESKDTSAGIQLKPDTGDVWEVQAIPGDSSPASSYIIYDRTDNAYRMVIDTNGHVGIPTASTVHALYVTGTIGMTAGGTGTKMVYSDIAEDIPAAADVGPADVVVIDPKNNQRVLKSSKPYDTAVAGIISTTPGFLIDMKDSDTPLALAGRVLCKVTTENGSIKRGDLLVTSSKPGYAMKADADKLKPGMVLGKALEPLEKKEGKIMVLVTLQ